MENELASEKNICAEIVIPEDNVFNNVSKILDISELDDKFYNHNILSPSNSISLYNEIIRRESNHNVNSLNKHFSQDKEKQASELKKAFFTYEINDENQSFPNFNENKDFKNLNQAILNTKLQGDLNSKADTPSKLSKSVKNSGKKTNENTKRNTDSFSEKNKVKPLTSREKTASAIISNNNKPLKNVNNNLSNENNNNNNNNNNKIKNIENSVEKPNNIDSSNTINIKHTFNIHNKILNRNKTISNFQSAKAEFNKSNKSVESSKKGLSFSNYNTSSDKISTKNAGDTQQVLKSQNKNHPNGNEKFSAKPNKKTKTDLTEVICEKHEINLENEMRLNKLKPSKSFSYYSVNKFKNSEKENTTKEKSSSIENKNLIELNVDSNNNILNKMGNSFLNEFSLIPKGKRSSHSQEFKYKFPNLESINAVNSNALEKKKKSISTKVLPNKEEEKESLKKNRNNSIINNKKNLFSAYTTEPNKNLNTNNNNNNSDKQIKIRKLNSDKIPFSPSSFASEENTSTAIDKAKEPKLSRAKIAKTHSCSNVGFLSNSSNRISDLNSGSKNANNTDNNNNVNLNHPFPKSNNNKQKKDFDTRMPLDRYSSMTNFNFFSDSKIRDRKQSNPFTPDNNTNNILNSTGTRFFTISEKDEEQIKEALNSEKVKSYLFENLNVIYDPEVQERLNNKFKNVINLFNDEIETCYKEGLEKLKKLSEEKLQKIIEINLKYETDLRKLESNIDYTNDQNINNVIYNHVLQDKQNELDEVSQFYEKAEKEVFDDIHAKSLDMKNKCFEKTKIQIENMKKYFSNEFFESLTNVLATSKNYHRIKFKKLNYRNVGSKLSSYINDRTSLSNYENRNKMSKSILMGSRKAPNPLAVNNNNKSETDNFKLNPNDKKINSTDNSNKINNDTLKIISYNNNENDNENLRNPKNADAEDKKEIHNFSINNKNEPLAEKSKKLNLNESSKFKKNEAFLEKKAPVNHKISAPNLNNKTRAKTFYEKESLKKLGFKGVPAPSLSVRDNPPLFEYYQTEVLLDLKSLRKQKLENLENNSNSKKDITEITNSNSNANLNSIFIEENVTEKQVE